MESKLDQNTPPEDHDNEPGDNQVSGAPQEKRQRLEGEDRGSMEETGKSLPQKKYFRQRAHSNPICDHVFD